jgi:Anti-sigma-K factor rskA
MTASRDRLLELLTDRALVGLGAREQIELAELLIQAQDVDIAAFDNAAAAVALASIGSKLEPMPAFLATAVEERALAAMAASHRPASDYAKTHQLDKLAPGFVQTQVDEIIDPTPAEISEISSQPQPRTDYKRTHMMDDRPLLAPVAPAPPSTPTLERPGAPFPMRASAPVPPSPLPVHGPQSLPPSPSYGPPASNVVAFAPRKPTNVVAIAGWLVAAACLLLAVGAFVTRKPGPGPVAIIPPPIPTPSATETAPPIPSARETTAQLRDKLLALAGTVRAEFAATKDPAGKSAGGEVVWNKDQQRGTMTFRGLAKNDPSRIQYQLWIFDKTRDDKYPVDGGVFDVDAETGDVVVPIKATLPVNTPTLFAITIEKPGGVVVSKREHLVLLAKL